jgi:ribosomal-protein-alanine N-acetyltransferase
MDTQPTLASARLLLRPFTLADAPDVHRLVSQRDIASTTVSIPHPYEEGMAAEWIEKHGPEFARGEGVVYAVTLRETGELMGAVGLSLVPAHRRAELGYWIGRPYWGHGYATEAARELVRWGFAELGLHRVVAHYMTHNTASGSVMKKIGMHREGTLRHHIYKWGEFVDIDAYGLLREEFEAFEAERLGVGVGNVA